jgi:hypothetical protein
MIYKRTLATGTVMRRTITGHANPTHLHIYNIGHGQRSTNSASAASRQRKSASALAFVFAKIWHARIQSRKFLVDRCVNEAALERDRVIIAEESYDGLLHARFVTVVTSKGPSQERLRECMLE